MRRLKQWSGLTYRQLSAHAEHAGDVLPYSTLAGILSRATLPRDQVVASFVRACGCDERQVALWLSQRRRIAAAMAANGRESAEAREADGDPDNRADGPGPHVSPATDGTVDGADTSVSGEEPAQQRVGQVPRSRSGRFAVLTKADARVLRRRRALGVAAAVGAAAALAAAGVVAMSRPESPSADRPAGPATTASSGAAAAHCRGRACRGHDPERHNCLQDGRNAGGVKTQAGLITLHHSAACRAIWAEISDAPDIISAHMKSDEGDVLTLRRERLTARTSHAGMLRTPMLPSKGVPRHAEVCVAYRTFEACAHSDGFSRVKPYPMPTSGSR